jgi:Ca-activated chloride channel homolog
MTEFRFAYPLLLILLLIPPFVYFYPRLQGWQSQSGLMRYSDTRLLGGEEIGWRVRLKRIPDVLRLIAWILLVIALARPQLGNKQQVIRGEGIDIVLVLDISTSMSEPDFQPYNRLEAAKVVIDDFISEREFDHIGLVVFARNAFQRAPLTLDYLVLSRLLGGVTLVSELRYSGEHKLDGTAIGMGLASAANMLRNGTSTNKVIVVLTDGDNNTGVDPYLAAEAVSTLGIRIYTVGMGKSGMENGVNEEMLSKIAGIGNGLYFLAEDTAGLQQIYDRIDMLERSDAELRIFVRWQDQATGLLFIALILLLADRILRLTLFQSIP